MNLAYAYELDTVEFIVDVSVASDSRTASLKLILDVTEGEPPVINPALCISNCKVCNDLLVYTDLLFIEVGMSIVCRSMLMCH